IWTVPLVPGFGIRPRRIINIKLTEIHSFDQRGSVDPVFALTAVILGLVFGSFLNVCIYRLPLGLSVVRPGSACPHCGKAIRFYDNVPVLSWIILGGHR